jgi:hypothetical protein
MFAREVFNSSRLKRGQEVFNSSRVHLVDSRGSARQDSCVCFRPGGQTHRDEFIRPGWYCIIHANILVLCYPYDDGVAAIQEGLLGKTPGRKQTHAYFY